MAAYTTAALTALAIAQQAYSGKRSGEKAKRREDTQKALAATPDEEELLEQARKRSAMARSKAKGGFGLGDTIRSGQPTLGNVGGGQSKLGSSY